MCDYSLHAFPNRLGVEGEELVVHRFGGASLGLASAVEVCAAAQCKRERAQNRKPWSWNAIKAWFLGRIESDPPVAAVCIPPGATLLLQDIPKRLQREFRIAEAEEVKFIEISADVNTYRDAIKFQNGAQTLLQALHEGQRAKVLSLGATEMEVPVFEEPATVRRAEFRA